MGETCLLELSQLLGGRVRGVLEDQAGGLGFALVHLHGKGDRPYIGSGIDWYRLITAMNRDKISVMCSIVQEIGAGINPLALAHPFVPGAAPATR